MQQSHDKGVRTLARIFVLSAALLATQSATAHRDHQGADRGSGQGGMMGGSMMQGRGMMGGPMMQGQGMMGGPMMQGQGMMGGPMMMQGHGMMGGPMMMQGHGMMGGVSPYAAGVLGLSDEQQQRIDGVQRERAREHWQLMQQMRQEGRELMQLQRSPDADPDAIAEAHERFSTTQREMLRMQAETRRAMRGILTEEQRQRLDEMQDPGGAQ